MAGEGRRSLSDEPAQCSADGSPGPSFGRDGALAEMDGDGHQAVAIECYGCRSLEDL